MSTCYLSLNWINSIGRLYFLEKSHGWSISWFLPCLIIFVLFILKKSLTTFKILGLHLVLFRTQRHYLIVCNCYINRVYHIFNICIILVEFHHWIIFGFVFLFFQVGVVYVIYPEFLHVWRCLSLKLWIQDRLLRSNILHQILFPNFGDSSIMSGQLIML